MHDVVTLGESMLRLSPPGHGRLRRARRLDLHVCGSQGNVAANLARLGLQTAFVTKVPDSALGLLVRDFYMSCGVNIASMRAIPHSRLGVNFIEFGATPRPSACGLRSGQQCGQHDRSGGFRLGRDPRTARGWPTRTASSPLCPPAAARQPASSWRPRNATAASSVST